MREIKYKSTKIYRKTPKGVLTNIYGKLRERNKRNGFGEIPFTLKEFHDRFLLDSTFLDLFADWQESDYLKIKKPSIDRINPNFGYSFENIEFMSWEENRKKADIENAKRYTTAVDMYDKETKNLVMRFDSVNKAVEYTGLSQGNIVMCCQGKRNYVGNYIFKYNGRKFRKPKTNNHPHLLKG